MEKMCLRKKVYCSEFAAQSAAKTIFIHKKVVMRTYKCPNCLQYHLSKDKEKIQQLKQKVNKNDKTKKSQNKDPEKNN